MTNILDNELAWAHPLVREWFLNAIGSPTEPQQQGWPAILAGKPTLISAPTGSGKTFAAFLIFIDQLVRKSVQGNLSNETEVLYVSPLKALGNDIQKNLMTPLTEIVMLARTKGIAMEEIRVAVRTGDTPARERQQMLKKPPHILVTTPESLYILLTADKSRTMLSTVKTVIVDEIHALVDDKRGAHLALSLERLDALASSSPVRIGLSATQRPIEVVAHFLAGNRHPRPVIINIGHVRHLDLGVLVPSIELSAVASNEMWADIYDQIAALSQHHRSILVFANTRRMAERAAHHLGERLGKDLVAAHHGSLSKKLRLAAENKLKQGKLKILVATASLELGIDIGSVDLVCQLGSPRSIAVMLQRVGRAGHWQGAISKGRIFATTCDELLECAALVHAILSGDLDHLIVPEEPLDVLAQQLVASCATGDWLEDDLYNLVTGAYPYRALSRQQFEALIDMLAEGISGTRGRYGAYLFRDRVNHLIKARRGSRLTAITCGGAIPENGLFSVITEPNGMNVGTLDEDFAVESNRGDIILLGSTSWRINRVESAKGRVLVEDAHGAPPSVPFWRGEAPERTKALSWHLSELRQLLSDKLSDDCSAMMPAKDQLATAQALSWLQTHCKLRSEAAEQVVDYILKGRAILGAVPTQQRIIAERFFDESGGMQLILHAPFGARINKAWGLALRKSFCRSFNLELQASATDNGINIALTEQHSFPLADVFQFLKPATLKKNLVQAVLQSPLFTTRWRWSATRALALVRFRNGKKVPPNLLRMRSEDLLAAVFPDAAACQDNLSGCDIELPDHPLIDETIKDCLSEALDLEGLRDILAQIQTHDVTCLAVDTPIPSLFSHEILNANPYAFLDDVPLEERRARAVEMRRLLPETLLNEIGALDTNAIREVQEQAWPDVRNADELHDVLQTMIVYPSTYSALQPTMWTPYFEELLATGRAGSVMVGDKCIWFAVEKAKAVERIYPQAIFNQILPFFDSAEGDREAGVLRLLQGWMPYIGPVTSQDLSHAFDLTVKEVDQALIRLETTGSILRGSFKTKQQEWCERRLLARIHRLTLGKLRKAIAPVTASEFMRWLLNWQHLAPGTQLTGEQGVLAIIKQLQGFEAPAKVWEREILSKRVKDYQAGLLDQLCMRGQIGWGRLSIPAQTKEEQSKSITPTSISPITFFLRGADWMSVHAPERSQVYEGLSFIAQGIYDFLGRHGASFFSDITHEVKGLVCEIERGLWELIASGLATADSFDNLRALIEPRRRLGTYKRRHGQLQYSSSRWSLLNLPKALDVNRQLEALCGLLLTRYGVVFRDLLAREKGLPRWRELLMTFRRLEDRGEIRGGRFVDGFLGEQFALPFAVDSLRAIKKKGESEGVITISASDPLNMVGFILPGSRVPAISGNKVRLKNGMVYTEEPKG